MNKTKILLGRWTRDELDKLISSSSNITDIRVRIGTVSERFLDTPYRESTLIGDIKTDEEFVINLEGLDCLTFIEYVEAMRLSSTFDEFRERLKRVRYREGKVAFKNRNHFFTDWKENNSGFVKDVTRETGGDNTVKVHKMLNEKEDGTLFIQGIQPVQREISYVPSGVIDDSLINKLKSGDYAGVYSEKPGLDVSHVGIIIKDGDTVSFRHASSSEKSRKVIDQDFKEYFSDKSGIVVLRPKGDNEAG